jgi:integrase
MVSNFVEIPIKELKEFNYNLLTGIKSDKTLSDYFMYLMDFLRNIYEIGDHNPDNTEVLKMLYNVTKEDISNYIMLLKNERELKHSSINKIISALKHFFKEIETRDDSFINPIKNIKFFKKEPLDPEKILRLTKDDIRKMIDSIEIRNEKDLRNILIMKTLYYTGMRSDELRSLTYKQILEKDGKYMIRLDKTAVKVLKRFEDYTLIECELFTGRTHQIRVHLSTMGHPIMGDELYDGLDLRAKRQLLHAYKLKLVNPKTKEIQEFEAELPTDIKKLINN